MLKSNCWIADEDDESDEWDSTSREKVREPASLKLAWVWIWLRVRYGRRGQLARGKGRVARSLLVPEMPPIRRGFARRWLC